jgi:hypothetical protein
MLYGMAKMIRGFWLAKKGSIDLNIAMQATFRVDFTKLPMPGMGLHQADASIS